MIKTLLQRWLAQPWPLPSTHVAAASAAAGDGTAATATPAHQPAASPGTATPGAPQGLESLSLQQLNEQRNALDRQRRHTEVQLEGLDADRRGLLTRYARARLQGKPHELRTLERLHQRLRARERTVQTLHADQSRYLDLLDRVQALREDADVRDRVMQGALHGRSPQQLEAMVGGYLATQQADRLGTQRLIDGMDVQAEDEALKQAHALEDDRAELMRLTEPLVQASAHAQLQPLEAAADELEAQVRARSAHNPPQATP